MIRKVILGVLVGLLVAVMFPAALAADPPEATVEEWIKSAEQVDTEDLGGVIVKAIKISDEVSAKPLDIIDQYTGSGPYTPDNYFHYGDSCGMVLKVNSAYTGTVRALYLWFGTRFYLFKENPGDFWFEFNITTPGTWLLCVYFTGGAPSWPGNYKFMGGVKSAWGRDWGFFNPSPYHFVIAP